METLGNVRYPKSYSEGPVFGFHGLPTKTGLASKSGHRSHAVPAVRTMVPGSGFKV